MVCFKKIAITAFCALTLTACSLPKPKTSNELNYQEDILLKAKNYTGLITLYRSWLKEKEDPAVRLKLAGYYYHSGDFKSSLYYLQPLATKPDLRVYTLQARNMISLGDYDQAIRVSERMLQQDPQSAEAFNLKGVALAMTGKLPEGGAAIQKARDMFIADDVALNNLAMVALLDSRYQDAVGLLLPQYLRGRKQPRMLHNLVLSLVKVGDIRYARDIIKSENLSAHPDELLDALSRLGPLRKEVA